MTMMARHSTALNQIGRIGFCLSCVGVAGVFLVGIPAPIVGGIGVWLALASIPGVLLSSIGTIRPPRRLAAWGLALGAFAAMYLPTILLPFLMSARR